MEEMIIKGKKKAWWELNRSKVGDKVNTRMVGIKKRVGLYDYSLSGGKEYS